MLISFANTLDLRSGRELGRVVLIALSTILLTNCTQLEQPKVEPFYAVTVPPPKQELRWSNGKTPKSFDPARAAAAPETDIVRAAYEGLTDLDSKSLREIPGVAEKWEASGDLRTWTFHLRDDARWSNGERVTARDFVNSWTRLRDLGDKAANTYLFQNIIGMKSKANAEKQTGEPSDFIDQPVDETLPQDVQPLLEPGISPRSQLAAPTITDRESQKPATQNLTGKKAPAEPKFGVEAVDDLTLKVSLELPDKDFPKLVSNPIFRPVYGDGANFSQLQLDPAIVTNGAFQITGIGEDGITLDLSDNYWNRSAVGLERVRFVPAKSAESALELYKKGEVDVVTNAAFKPLALKLLAPYEDFRRTAHSALNFYEFNTANAPFSDRRVRVALAISIDRAKLTEDDLGGTNQPAYAFFPLGEHNKEILAFDIVKAKELLEIAGYADGIGFPPIQLVVNRNDIQQRIARSIARMWKQNLNIETDVIVVESSKIEDIGKSGEFDLLRRGAVLPTNDELVNIVSIFGSAKKVVEKSATPPITDPSILPENQKSILNNKVTIKGSLDSASKESIAGNREIILTMTEDDAIFELKAIPLYFPTAYSLVKPYIRGFETNGLDAPSLKEVSIDNNWQPKSTQGEQ